MAYFQQMKWKFVRHWPLNFERRNISYCDIYDKFPHWNVEHISCYSWPLPGNRSKRESLCNKKEIVKGFFRKLIAAERETRFDDSRAEYKRETRKAATQYQYVFTNNRGRLF